jgi:hypothetical protein
MLHTIHVTTIFQNNYVSAIDNIFIDLSRLHVYVVLPSMLGLSDHNTQCTTLNKCFVKTNVTNDKFKNKLKSRLMTKDTVSYCQELLSREIWEIIYLNNDVNGIFNDFLKTFLNTFEASFSVI